MIQSMLKKILSIITALCMLFTGFCLPYIRIYAQTVTPTATPTPDTSSAVQSLEQQISNLESKISDLQGQEKTLSTQISVMDSQIQLTQLQINDTQQKIMDLTLNIATANTKISSLQGSIDNLTKVLLTKIVATYEVGSSQPFQVLMAASDIHDFFIRANYLKIAQAHDKQLVYDTVQAKNDYANQKQIYEDEKKQVEALNVQLTAYNTQLDQEKAAKQSLLSQTQGSEAIYQQQLTAAQAELASFSNFVTSQGGASLLSGQTSCDSWGCYYNQRDSQWGNIAINGQSGYSIAGYGCLITSLAMVASHMGHTDILPSDIAAPSFQNFDVGTALLAYSINAKGHSISRNPTNVSGNSWPDSRIDSLIDSDLPNGPVIVGMYAYGGTHFVVLKGGSGGNYIMDDPFVPNGKDISFTSHYTIASIFEVDTVSM